MPKPRNRPIFAWRPVAIYIAAVAVAGAGLVIWDRAYEAHQGGAPASSLQPEVIAKRLVENVVGAGTVESSTLDSGTGTLTVRVKDVVTDKAKTPAQNKELLTGEGTQAVESILGLVSFKHVVVQLVKGSKVEATVRAEPGKKPQTDFSPDPK